jgi:glycosyltransferase involved in cell wall biosynthesis
MRIGFYARGLANKAGIGRYSRELLKALLDCPHSHTFRLFAGRGVPREGLPSSFSPLICPLGGRGDRLLEEQWCLRRSLCTSELDLYHNPDFTLPMRLPKSLKAVVTVHDVAYLRLPGSNSWKSKALLRALVPGSIRRADAIVTVSEFSKREIVQVYGCPPEKVFAIPNGVDQRFLPQSEEEVRRVREKYGLPERGTVLYVGGIEPRKNLVRLAKAVSDVPGATLVIAGGRNRGAEQILQEARVLLRERLLELGFFPDEDLPGLYASAEVFAYPSLYEGFGIPPLEAMACGTPVLASNATSVPEAVGDAALLINPKSTSDITEKLCRLLDDPALQRELRERGELKAQRFTWQSVASQTLALYEQIVN